MQGGSKTSARHQTPPNLGSREREEEKDGKGGNSLEVLIPSPPTLESEFSRSEMGSGTLEGSAAPSFRKQCLSCKFWTKTWGSESSLAGHTSLESFTLIIVKMGALIQKEVSSSHGTW